jgi:Cft2 family RNA processing exonuclease
MFLWDDDLRIEHTGLFLDSRQARPLCFVSHAHSDHLGEHQVAICTPQTARLAEQRIAIAETRTIGFGEPVALDRDTRVELLSAGHVLGSAMIHVTRPEGSLLYTGDFKLRSCLTVPCAQVTQADVLVMESTYGKPFFRFPPWQQVAAELVERVGEALRAGRQPIVMGYSLGKAQEIVRILTDAGVPVTCHGAVANVNATYEKLGVSVGRYRRYDFADFHGDRPLDLAERGVLVAPPQVARSAFVERFANPLRIMMSGWALLSGAQYRYGVDHVLPLSDHADFDELLELIERVNPKKIYTHHGYPEFADTLRAKGYDARRARKDPQLTLFD